MRGFDEWDYNTHGDEHRGSVFRVDTETADGGKTSFMNGSIMRSRLFHDFDDREVVNLVDQYNDDGSRDMDTQFSDSLLTVNADFADVFAEVSATTGMDAQYKKVQYDPVFGFQYDLKSKQEFQIYLDQAYQDKTYYYAVVNSENEIARLQLDGYDDAGYNGEMWGNGDGFYAETNNPLYDNIWKDWILDWENLFQGMQLDVEDNISLYAAVRMLHAETYANISQTAFDVMNQFTRNRERNAVSALFQVEKEFGDEACEPSLAEFDPRDFYVRDPVRFWASAFGAHGDQSANSGGQNELAYDNTVWGGSVGAIKELGDYYAGATLGYADATTKYDYADVKSRSYLAEALVGARIFCNGFAEAYASYSYNDNRNTRVVDLSSDLVGGYFGVATGEFASHVFGGGLRLGWQKTLGQNWLFLPTLAVNVLHHRGAGFTESGRVDMANRMVFDKDSMNRTMVRIPVEFRLNRAVALGDFMLMPEVRAGITPLLGDKQGEATAKWVGHPTDNRYFTSIGASRGDFEGWIGATVELSKKGRFYAAANYDYVYSNKDYDPRLETVREEPRIRIVPKTYNVVKTKTVADTHIVKVASHTGRAQRLTRGRSLREKEYLRRETLQVKEEYMHPIRETVYHEVDRVRRVPALVAE